MLPTSQEFKAAALDILFEQLEWAKQKFHISNLPVKLKVTDRRLNFYGQARIVRDKQERFTHYEVKVSSHFVLRHPVIAFSEYASINNSKVIGGFETNEWRLWLSTLVAHELSHVMQYALRMAALDAKAYGREHPLVTSWNGATPVFGKMGAYEGGHGPLFKHLYAQFRKQWVNARIAPGAMNSPGYDFELPDDFEARMNAMPKSGLEGIAFDNKGRTLVVVGRNPKRNHLFGYVVRDPQGVLRRCKMLLIAEKSKEALERIKASQHLTKEFLDHSEAMQTKARANAKSSMVKRGRAARCRA